MVESNLQIQAVIPFLMGGRLKNVVRCIAAIGLSFAVGSAWAVSLEAVADNASVEEGRPVEIAILISDLGDAMPPSLGSADILLSYDATLFTYTGFSSSRVLGATDLNTVAVGASEGNGEVNLFAVSYLPPGDLLSIQPASFTVFTAHFLATTAGVGGFSLAVNGALGDEDGMQLTPLQITDTDVAVLISDTVFLDDFESP